MSEYDLDELISALKALLDTHRTTQYLEIYEAVGVTVLFLIIGYMNRAPAAAMLLLIALIMLVGTDNLTTAISPILIALTGIIAVSMIYHKFKE